MKNILLIAFLFLSTFVNGQELFPLQGKHSVSKKSVDIKVISESGEQELLKDILTSENNYIVSIMATWCGPCRVELDAFQEVATEWKKKYNVEIVALSVDKPTSTQLVFDLAKKQGWNAVKVYHEDMGYTARELGVHRIPQTFLVNGKGEIIYKSKGFHSNLISKFEKEIKKLN